MLLQLALEIVADGEGASRVGRVEVSGAADAERGRARRARGRQLAARPDGAARPRPQLGPDRPGGRDGARRRGPRGAGARTTSTPPGSATDEPEAELSLRLGRGDATAHVYFSDLTCDYVRLNSEYTT